MGDDRARTARGHDQDLETPVLIGDDRDRTAEDRDQISEAHDRTSENRDERAEARDERAEERDHDATSFDAEAASDRAGAKRDRQGAAGDRSHAAHDREAASTDRVISVVERKACSIDQLTGAYRRDTGLVELERESVRAMRTNQPFVLAFIDVDNFKATNDSLGHSAGDQLLREIVDTMRTHLRPYDLIVRFGGDEFLCVLPGLNMAQVSRRFLFVHSDLHHLGHASITVGLAELHSDDSLEDLISRADADLYSKRQRRSIRT
jgi:diguanylate cyclase (GGDEF)-like protein